MSRRTQEEAEWEQRHDLARQGAVAVAAATLLGPHFYNLYDDPHESYIKAAVRIAELLWKESGDY